MAKKNVFDSTSAFKSIVGEKETDKNIIEPDKSDVIDENESKMAKSKKLVQKSYYITEKQYKALKLRAATSEDPREKDISAIVRAALDMYLELEIEKS